MAISARFRRWLQPFKHQLRVVALLALILIVLELINLLTMRSLTVLSIVPRQLSSLPMLLSAPLVHGNLWHFLSNLVPFCVLAFLSLQYGKQRFISVSLAGVLITGICVWFFARPVPHMGINGVLYCYLGFILLAGFLSKETRLVLLSVAVGVFYGGMVFGVLPLNSYISWESNLFGFLTGIGCALLLVRRPVRDISIEA